MQANPQELPECLTRDNLTSEYFPNLGRTGLFAIIGMCLVFVFTSIHRLNHTDLWGPWSYGRWIVEQGSLPAHDPFSVQGADAKVVPFAWLAQVAGYWTHRVGGSEGLILAHAFLETLAAGIVMLAIARRGVKGVWPAVGGVMFVLLSLPIMGTIRPQLFAQVGMALTLLALSELPKYKHPLYWLPVVFALWVNLHASMLMGLVTLGVVTAGLGYAIWEKQKNWSAVLQDEVVRRHLLAIVVAMIGGSLSPIGPAIYWKVGTFSRSTMLASISEWQGMTPASLTGALLISSAIIAFIAFRQWTKPLPWGEVALLGLFGLATLTAIRMLVWWSMVWPWVVIPVLAEWFAAAFASEEPAEGDEPTSMRTLVGLAVVFMAILFAPPTHSLLHNRQRGISSTSGADTPIYVTDEMVRRNLHGTFFAPMDWADYMIWQTHGALKPLAYSHIHLSDKETWEAYRDIYIGDEVWLRAAREQQIQFVVAARDRNKELIKKMAAAEGSGNARVVYQDTKCVVAEVLPEKKKAPAKVEETTKPEPVTNTQAAE
jgi:hypothetical protein